MWRKAGIWEAAESEVMLFDCDTTLRAHGKGRGDLGHRGGS